MKTFVSALLLIALGTPALGASGESSAVVPYPVKGRTAREIYDDIKLNAPRIAPNATFAFTAMATKTVKAHKVDGAGCHYKGFTTSVIYNFFIPQLAGGSTLKAGVAKKWTDFTAYLQTHEEGHRDIWRACFKQYDAQAVKLTGSDCKDLDVQREALFTVIKQACVQKDEDYDVIFRKAVVNHPFMREALKPGGDNGRKD